MTWQFTFDGPKIRRAARAISQWYVQEWGPRAPRPRVADPPELLHVEKRGRDERRDRYLAPPADPPGDVEQIGIGALVLDHRHAHAAHPLLVALHGLGHEVGRKDRPSHADEGVVLGEAGPLTREAAVGAVGVTAGRIGLEEIDAVAGGVAEERAGPEPERHRRGDADADILRAYLGGGLRPPSDTSPRGCAGKARARTRVHHQLTPQHASWNCGTNPRAWASATMPSAG